MLLSIKGLMILVRRYVFGSELDDIFQSLYVVTHTKVLQVNHHRRQTVSRSNGECFSNGKCLTNGFVYASPAGNERWETFRAINNCRTKNCFLRARQIISNERKYFISWRTAALGTELVARLLCISFWRRAEARMIQ